MAGALIITAELGASDQARFDAQRARHFPPERNRLPAHLTMFHALPPSAELEVKRRLGELASQSPPRAIAAGLMNLGGGVAFRIVSDDLERIRDSLTDDFRGLLSAQDAGGWRPHITVQNKVSAKEARRLLIELERDFAPGPVKISGLGLHRYLDGPWEPVAVYPFRS
jgi:hypothetical protein